MQPGEHVLDAFLHQFRDGGLERRLVRAEEVPAFLRELGPKLLRDIDRLRLIGVGPDDLLVDQAAQLRDWMIP